MVKLIIDSNLLSEILDCAQWECYRLEGNQLIYMTQGPCDKYVEAERIELEVKS